MVVLGRTCAPIRLPEQLQVLRTGPRVVEHDRFPQGPLVRQALGRDQRGGSLRTGEDPLGRGEVADGRANLLLARALASAMVPSTRTSSPPANDTSALLKSGASLDIVTVIPIPDRAA